MDVLDYIESGGKTFIPRTMELARFIVEQSEIIDRLTRELIEAKRCQSHH